MDILLAHHSYITRCGLHTILQQRYFGVKITMAASEEELKAAITRREYDLLITGSRFAGNSLLHVLKETRQSNPRLQILCILEKEADGYGAPATIDAAHVIIPDAADEQILISHISRCMEEVETHTDFFFVKFRSERRKIFWKDVAFITASKNYVRVGTVHGKEEYLIRGTLASVLEQQLPPELQTTFIRLGRSVSVNRNFVTAYNVNEVTCSGITFENTRLRLREMHGFFKKEDYAPSMDAVAQ